MTRWFRTVFAGILLSVILWHCTGCELVEGVEDSRIRGVEEIVIDAVIETLEELRDND